MIPQQICDLLERRFVILERCAIIVQVYAQLNFALFGLLLSVPQRDSTNLLHPFDQFPSSLQVHFNLFHRYAGVSANKYYKGSSPRNLRAIMLVLICI